MRSVLRALALWLAIASAGAAHAAAAQPQPDPRPARIAALLRAYADLDQLSGTVLVAERGTTLFRGAFGFSDRELRVPAAPEHRFLIGSLTKAFTAVLALQEVASGRIALDTPAVRYWRDFPDPSGGAITVRHLLTHRSGLKHWGGVEGFLDGRARLRHDPAEVVGLYAAQGLAFPPGTAEDYSSIGYMVVGILLEKVSIETRQRWSTGGILSTVDDLLRWDLALNTAKLLPDSLRALVCERTDGEAAYGWRIRELAPGVRAFWHVGLETGVSEPGRSRAVSWTDGDRARQPS